MNYYTYDPNTGQVLGVTTGKDSDSIAMLLQNSPGILAEGDIAPSLTRRWKDGDTFHDVPPKPETDKYNPHTFDFAQKAWVPCEVAKARIMAEVDESPLGQRVQRLEDMLGEILTLLKKGA